uniref:C-C motif chemokine n=1 Tax=Myripristis murdjan TaxID=586833 RepID=A0A667X1P4_9TELE
MVLIRTAVLALMLLTIVSECCRSYTRGIIPCNAIKGYSVQTVKELCHINAIIFYTKKGRAACTNPALGWVMTCCRGIMESCIQVNHYITTSSSIMLYL